MSRNRSKAQIIGALTGVIISTAATLTGVGLLTQATLSQRIGEGGTNIAIPTLLVLASFIGSHIAAQSIKENKIHVKLYSAGIFIFTIVISSLVIEGPFSNIGINLVSIIAGTVISCALCLKKTVNKRYMKKHYR